MIAHHNKESAVRWYITTWRVNGVNRNEVERQYQVFHPGDALENNVGLIVGSTMVHDAGAIDQEDALHEGDVLPHFGLPGDWRDLAHLSPAPWRHRLVNDASAPLLWERCAQIVRTISTTKYFATMIVAP